MGRVSAPRDPLCTPFCQLSPWPAWGCPAMGWAPPSPPTLRPAVVGPLEAKAGMEEGGHRTGSQVARPMESCLVVPRYAAPGGCCRMSLFLISKEPLTVAPRAGLGCSLTAESVWQVCLSACWSTPEGRGERAPRWRDGESPTCSGAHPRGWVEPTRAGHQVRSPAGAWLCPSEALAPRPSSSWTNHS